MLARVVPFAVLAALLYPLSFAPGRDSFPLSSYPMFARARTSSELAIDHFLVAQPDGSARFVAPAIVASGEVLQVRALIGEAIARGPQASAALCADVAARLAGREGHAGLELRLVRARYDALAYLTGRDTRGTQRVHVRCPIPAAAAR